MTPAPISNLGVRHEKATTICDYYDFTLQVGMACFLLPCYTINAHRQETTQGELVKRTLFRRRERILRPKYQLKMACFVVIFMLFYSVVFALATYYPLGAGLEEAVHPADQARVASVILGLEETVWPALIFVLFLTFIGAILFSHRIVGPVCRLEKAVDGFVDGRFERIHLRKTDELKEIETHVNKLADYLGSVKESDSFFRAHLKERLTLVADGLGNKEKAGHEKARELLDDLISELDADQDVFSAHKKRS